MINDKSLKVSEFISKALFDPKTGYYRTKNPIGKNSDFITAPEISQVFGELTASYLLHIFSTKSGNISLVEMGAGKGTWLFDILSSIKKLADKNIPQAIDFFKRTEFHIIEINKALRKIQQERLKDFEINWHENFNEINQQLTTNNQQLFFISNELFDCFEIDQYIKTDIGWCERLVEEKDQKLQFITANFSQTSHKFVENILGVKKSEEAPFGAVFEYSQTAQDFMRNLCETLQKQGGIAINFDYGYFSNSFANTLQALQNHTKVSVLENPGEADITSHVNFAALDKIVKAFKLSSSLITQEEFLTSLGIEERRKILLKQNPKKADEINSAIDRLIKKDQMGELFKCHIIWKD